MDEFWDAVVVGAGPAGGVTAALLAERGWRVLLVEKKTWPREKACGGCLNAAGVRMLGEMGLGRTLEGAKDLSRFEVHVGNRQLSIEMPAGVVVARAEFDARLVCQARERGAVFMAGCGTRLLAAERGEPFRTVRLKRDGEETHVRAKVVMACDGLHGTTLGGEPWAQWEAEPGARIGVSMTVSGEWARKLATEESIGMFVGTEGYVGIVRQGERGVHIGASVDPVACHQHGGPTRVVARIFQECGVSAAVENADFEGTGPLTGRRKQVGGYRALAVGDACGYVEPFTGEGMSWAIRGAREVARLLPRRVDTWPADFAEAWQALHEREVSRRQVWCRWLREIVKRPGMAATCMTVAQCVPWAPAMIARQIGA